MSDSIPSQRLKEIRGRGTQACVGASNSITDGIRVTVQSEYIPEQSTPAAKRYVFAYTIRISNEGTSVAQLRSRHWVITDSSGKVEEVRGPGVVGKQPALEPGQAFEYTSGCMLQTPRGEMRGSYQMQRKDGTTFEADVAAFELALPYTLN